MAIFLIAYGPMQTTAGFAAVTTGTSIKTLLQLKASLAAERERRGISANA